MTVDLGQTSTQNTGGDGFDTLANLEDIEGSDHADVLSGNDGTNRIRAGRGADTLDGRGGNDTLDGGDTASGVLSPDTAIYASAASGVTADLVAAVATGGGGTDSLVDIQNVTGSDFEDVLTGNAEENLLRGGGGPDTLTGGAGGDDVRGEGGGDELMLRDGTRDVADCGSEPDDVTADAFGVDAIDANCETIDYLGGIPTPSPGGGDAGNPATGGDDAGGGAGTGVPSNAFTIARVTLSRRTGGATLTLNLPGAGVLRGVATAKIPARLLRSRAARRITVARKRMTVTQPGLTKLALRPSRAAKRVMRRRGKLRVTLVVTYTPTGGAPSTQRRTLTLKLRRRR